jgi:hypothetical protein
LLDCRSNFGLTMCATTLRRRDALVLPARKGPFSTLLADRHREYDLPLLPLSRAVDLVYQKCTISREGR